jgi:signal transduction histidine kinase
MSYTQGLAVQLRADVVPQADVADVLDKVAALSGQALALADSIRKLSSPRSIEWERVDLNKVVQQTLELVAAPIRETGIVARVELTPELPDLEGNFLLLIQVVLNLVLNAIQALGDTARAERSLYLRTAISGSESIALLVQDTGGGLDPDVVARLFQPFVTTEQEGLGLGLSISRRIVLMHGGRLWVNQKPVRGAAFHITLPLHLSDRGRHSPEQQHKATRM